MSPVTSLILLVLGVDLALGQVRDDAVREIMPAYLRTGTLILDVNQETCFFLELDMGNVLSFNFMVIRSNETNACLSRIL